ncbi:hypothetical protein TRFO_29026 [Tritrichomonas foetus]|uniref:Leucine Rich Repeat family protein n=1 Tax=Tritrichomonas foetus TaxID=1144522 RepID=A0A1J4JWR7_9EUKA|nr:hypothetical protein TRFO_29026 [Tritrichomonas foetus]|eukprot:OHT03591.1 hypothetical protein TRFO_29026 [Tritrichomonas foetus]
MKKKSLLTTRTKRNSIEIGEQTISSLSAKEKSTIASYFPDYDNYIHFFSNGQIKTQGQQYENGICALSMHYVGIFFQKHPGKVKKIAFFNIFCITKFVLSYVNRRQQLLLETETTDVRLLSGPVLTTARLIYRNYSFATFPLPQSLKTTFHATDSSLLPSVQFPLSISQIFQFRFAALSSQNELNYDHSIVQYFHSLIQSHNPILNLKHLPKTFVIQQLRPLLQAILYIPIILGISCCNNDIPQIFSLIIPLIEESHFLRKIKLTNCNAKDGLLEFSRALESNTNLPLEQIFINENEFDDLSPFIHSISLLQTNLTHLSVSGCGLSSEVSEQLCKCLLTSNSLKSLKHLGIGGIVTTENATLDFFEYLKTNCHLVSLDLSGSSSFSSFLDAIPGSSVQILNVSCCEFDDTSIDLLNSIAPYLTSLDISGSNMNYYEVSDVISLLGKSIPSSLLTIKLNQLNFQKERSLLIMRGFLANDLNKWHRIEMDETRISTDELIAFQSLFMHMNNLEILSMGSNFNENDAAIVSSLTEIESLKVLKLANSKLASIIPQIIATPTLREVDLSFNNLTDEQAILLLSTENLKKVNLNGIDFSDENSLLVTASENPHLTHPPFDGALVTLKEPINESIDDSDELKSNRKFSEIYENEINKSNVFQHSSVCEDFRMSYPFIDQFYESQAVEIGDPDIYNTFNQNLIVIENHKNFEKLKKILVYPHVENEKDESESGDDSDLSIDALMNDDLISTLSETMFTGLGGILSDSSSNDEKKDKTKNNLEKNSNSCQKSDKDTEKKSDKENPEKGKEQYDSSPQDRKGKSIDNTDLIDAISNVYNKVNHNINKLSKTGVSSSVATIKRKNLFSNEPRHDSDNEIIKEETTETHSSYKRKRSKSDIREFQGSHHENPNHEDEKERNRTKNVENNDDEDSMKETPIRKRIILKKSDFDSDDDANEEKERKGLLKVRKERSRNNSSQDSTPPEKNKNSDPNKKLKIKINNVPKIKMLKLSDEDENEKESKDENKIIENHSQRRHKSHSKDRSGNQSPTLHEKVKSEEEDFLDLDQEVKFENMMKKSPPKNRTINYIDSNDLSNSEDYDLNEEINHGYPKNRKPINNFNNYEKIFQKQNSLNNESPCNSPSKSNSSPRSPQQAKSAKFFGSIDEESMSSKMQNRKKIPPIVSPSNDDSSAFSTVDSTKYQISASLKSNTKKKDNDEKQNPIILAFSPPSLPS